MIDKMQGRIDGFVLRNYYAMTIDQMVATIMMELGIFYDQARKMVLKSLKELHIK